MDYPTKIEKTKELLTLLYNDDVSSINNLNLNNRDFFTVISHAVDNLYVVGYQLTKTKCGGIVLDPNPQLTPKGFEYLYPPKQELPAHQNSYTFHAPVTGSVIGDNGTINNNNFEVELSKLKTFINDNLTTVDKHEAEELVTIIEKKEVKEGMLRKFENLFERYPGLFELVNLSISAISLF